MPDTYFPLHLSTPNPLKAVFRGPDGRALFSTSTDGRTTVIRRIYGRSAKTIRQQQDGLVLAEIEWMDRVRSSRIRFKGVDVDVRIDEYLKETRGGRSVPRFPNTPRLCIGSKCATNALFVCSGQSRMFATSDGRTYKWKAGCPGDSAELFECASGKRVSGLLASSNPSMSTSSPLPTPPPTPPIILSPAPTAALQCSFEVPSISLSEPEQRREGEKPTLRVHTGVLNLIDQIVVTWIIMERDRSMRKAD